MKFFFVFFAVITAICGYFWATDAPGSGMVWPTCLFAGLALGVGAYNWHKNGSPLSEKAKPPTTLNSALFLFLLNFNLPGWWLVGLLLFVVWLWALTRKQSGDYDFGPGLAIVGALIFTGAIALGVVAGYLLA